MIQKMETKPIITALVAFARASYPKIDYDDSGIADPDSFPTSVISSFTVSEDERGVSGSFTVDHWAKSEHASADSMQTLCDGVKAALSKKVITFTGGIFLPWFDSELSDPEEPDYIHKVQSFSGSIYGG